MVSAKLFHVDYGIQLRCEPLFPRETLFSNQLYFNFLSL